MAQSIACPICGHVNPSSALNCSACGVKLPFAAQDDEDAPGDGPRLTPILATSRMAPPTMAPPSYAPAPMPMAAPPSPSPTRRPVLFIVVGIVVAAVLILGALSCISHH